jgi:hypothetical protein
MTEIPISAIPSQVCKVVLDGQICQIKIYQKESALFVDINADGVDINVGTIALDTAMLVSRDYAGFRGNLFFIDTQGNDDPDYSGLGSRYSLIYITEEEYALLQ